ncbi:16764_t:CDS:2, partial [Entrophospora sp. SA101]
MRENLAVTRDVFVEFNPKPLSEWWKTLVYCERVDLDKCINLDALFNDIKDNIQEGMLPLKPYLRGEKELEGEKNSEEVEIFEEKGEEMEEDSEEGREAEEMEEEKEEIEVVPIEE